MTLTQHFLRLLSVQPSPDKPKLPRLSPEGREKALQQAARASRRKAEQGRYSR